MQKSGQWEEPMAEIQLKNVCKRWGAFVGVDDFNLTIADKEFLVLLGPSGCGKTTTMRMVAGLEDVTEGEIKIDGKLVNDLEPKDRDVAMVFQSYALYPHLSVYDNIRFPLKVRNVDPKTHDEKVRRASAMVELDEFLHRKPSELSGGQRQRVALARAIVREPKLRVSTRAQIKNLSHELAVTTIYVTHDQIEAMTLADRVVIMKKGVVQQVGSPTEIYDSPANAFVASFIGNPAMNLIDGEMDSGVFRAQNTEVQGLKAPDGPVTLGFRAEDADVVESGGQVNAPIYTMELLGDSTMVSIRVGGALVSVKAGKNFRAEIDEMVSIRVDTDHCHLFDATTGARVKE